MYSIKTILNQPIDPLDAEVLLSYVLKKTKEYLFFRSENYVSSKQEKKFLSLVKKRQAGWPVAYLTNQKEFFGLKFFVNKNVLIPRPETEGLVELILETISAGGGSAFGGNNQNKLNILDVGAGSGCIIISLAKTLFAHSRELDHQYFASDISKNALAIARKNAKFHKTKITFKQSDLLKNWSNQHFDIIVANLPYLEKQTDPSTKFEPIKALVAKKNGLALYEKLLKQIANRKDKPLYIFLEIAHNQSTKIKNLVKKLLPYYDINISRDLAGLMRYAVIFQKSF